MVSFAGATGRGDSGMAWPGGGANFRRYRLDSRCQAEYALASAVSVAVVAAEPRASRSCSAAPHALPMRFAGADLHCARAVSVFEGTTGGQAA